MPAHPGAPILLGGHRLPAPALLSNGPLPRPPGPRPWLPCPSSASLRQAQAQDCLPADAAPSFSPEQPSCYQASLVSARCALPAPSAQCSMSGKSHKHGL